MSYVPVLFSVPLSIMGSALSAEINRQLPVGRGAIYGAWFFIAHRKTYLYASIFAPTGDSLSLLDYSHITDPILYSYPTHFYYLILGLLNCHAAIFKALLRALFGLNR